ncbi:hypothetical protein C7999DRAFT_32522 [Corynascus novoguineensis]|uniref:Uncharacterized protein n=1 Tax=Corynascus novoguineensis TaxID=1126955 RepID=A0AAN7CRL8_9PEZI|nr:hypothetical protein C7999DRAFT_32522 [Corynascus novoguineensis]
MRFTLITVAVIAGLFRTCICDEVAGYSELANDLFAPLAATSDTSPNLTRNIFSRQTQWCTAGSPYVICPTPRTCCNAKDNWLPSRLLLRRRWVMPEGADINLTICVNLSVYINLSGNYNVTVYYYPQHCNLNSLFGYFHLQNKDY